MSVNPVRYDVVNESAHVSMNKDQPIPSCSSSSSSKEHVYLTQMSRHSYDGEASSGSTAGSFTVTNLTRTLDIQFEKINYTVKTGLLKKGKFDQN